MQVTAAYALITAPSIPTFPWHCQGYTWHIKKRRYYMESTQPLTVNCQRPSGYLSTRLTALLAVTLLAIITLDLIVRTRGPNACARAAIVLSGFGLLLILRWITGRFYKVRTIELDYSELRLDSSATRW